MLLEFDLEIVLVVVEGLLLNVYLVVSLLWWVG